MSGNVVPGGGHAAECRVLCLITNGTKKRTVSDKAVYWKSTRAGDEYLVALRAVPTAAQQENED